MSRRVMNLAHFLTQAARRFPDRTALVWGERRWSWAEMDARVSALAIGLRGRGIAPGDRVLVHARNGNGILEAMLASWRIGAVFVPTNFRLLPDDVAGLAQASGARAFLCHADFPAHAAAVAAAVPGLALLAGIGAGVGETDLDAIIAAHAGERIDDAAVQYDDPCWFFFTSGTTGRPKASVLTHGQMAFVVNNHLCDLLPGTDERDACLVVAPLSHGAGVHQLLQIARATTTVLPATTALTRRSAGAWWSSSASATCSPCPPSSSCWWNMRPSRSSIIPPCAT